MPTSNRCAARRSAAALALCAAVGCATTAVPAERLAHSVSAIRVAEEVGAADVPAAALHLQLAREQAEAARALIADGANVRADYVLQRAEADAELALALAREAPLRAAAQAALQRLQPPAAP